MKTKRILKEGYQGVGCDTPDGRKKPRTCTIGRKCWPSVNGGCTIPDLGGQEKKRVEEHLNTCEALALEEEIGGDVEAVSFDDTFKEIEDVVEEGLSEDQMIPVNSVDIYEVIEVFDRAVGSDLTTRVDTRYKIVDRKVLS